MNRDVDVSLRAAFAALARGDMVGLDTVWRELAGPLHNYAFALTSSHEDADDILGDCLERLARRGWRLRLVHDPKGYLFTSVRNAARSRRRRAPEAAIPSDHAAPTLDTAGDAAVRAGVMTLSAEQREVVVLHIWGGLTFREIGHTVGIPANTAASRYRHAIARLRELLGDESHGPLEAGRPAQESDTDHAGHCAR